MNKVIKITFGFAVLILLAAIATNTAATPITDPDYELNIDIGAPEMMIGVLPPQKFNTPDGRTMIIAVTVAFEKESE